MDLLPIGTDLDRADTKSPQFVGKREADTLMLLHLAADRPNMWRGFHPPALARRRARPQQAIR
jgi:hypothetical protein